jgi:hypothetical protein
MKKYIILLGIFSIALLQACEKTIQDDRRNPFGDSNTVNNQTDSLNPTSIEGLHQNIFSVKCANPTCHDGSFEPDFRTIQSTYASLVYHPVVKNDDQNSFYFRVTPGNPEESWLVRRVLVDDILGKMPLYAEPLSNEEIQQIKDWIGNGAKNILDSSVVYPNLPPTFLGYAAVDSNQNRVDVNRLSGAISPFIFPEGTTITLAFLVEDDATAPQNLQNQRVDFSYIKDDFSGAITRTLTHLSQNISVTTLDANVFMKDSIVFFRYYGEDEEGAFTLIPNSQSPFYFNDYLSFIVQ